VSQTFTAGAKKSELEKMLLATSLPPQSALELRLSGTLLVQRRLITVQELRARASYIISRFSLDVKVRSSTATGV
jgi:hypothetical protein